MSKTLGSILMLAGSAALVATGIGAAAGLALFGTTAGVSVAGIGLTTLLTASTVLTAAGSLIAQAGIKSPRPEQMEGSLKVPTPPRVSGYGTNRYNMAYALFTTARDGTAVDVGVFHDGKASAIRAHYIGDKRVTLTGSGYVIGLPDGQFGENDDNVRVGTRLGNAVETAFSEVIAKVPDQWTANHRGNGCVTGFMLSKAVKTKNYQKIYPSGGPNQTPLSLVLDAQPVFDWRDPTQSVGDPRTWKFSENACLHHAHYELVRKAPSPTLPPTDPGYWAEIAATYTARWNRLFAPTLSYWTAAANDCDSPVPLKGVQTIMLEAADSGSGHITVAAVDGLATGMTIAVSATGDTSLTELRTVTGITPGGGGFVLALSDDLDNDHPEGSQVTWSSSPSSPATEPRYRGCVAHKHTDDHKSVIASLLACYDGWVSPRSDGALVVYSGRYVEPGPDDEIGPDEIISYSIQDGVDEENAINTIAVSYISANHDYSVVETTPWVDDEDVASRGKELATTLANQVPSHAQARRLTKRALAKTMAAKRGTVSTNYLGKAKVLGKRFIRLRIVEAGTTFLDAPVEIIKLVRNISTGGVTFEWILADPNIDAWNPATEEGEPAPVGNRSAPAPLAAPEITSAAADFTSVSDDGTGVKIIITAEGPGRDDEIWYARWREVGAATWNEAQYTDLDPSTSVELSTGFVPTGAMIEVAVAYQIGDGRISPWSTPATEVDTATDATPPDAAGAINLVSWADTLSLTTTRIARATSYRWRIYAPSDLTTPIRTVVTTTPAVGYSSTQAVLDGIRRDYVVKVAGVNAAGAGTESSTPTLSLAAPAAVTGVSATGGASNAEVDFTLSADPLVTGYIVATSTASGFNPMTQGFITPVNGSPAYLQNLAAGTFYTKVAARDAWTDRPDLLNFSTEDDFVITTGGGGGGGGGGDGGGGYCVTTDAMILMADGTKKPAGELEVGDMVRTQHEETLEWGDHPVVAVEVVDSDDVWFAQVGIIGLKATGDHRIWINGWVRMRYIGVPVSPEQVVRITVDEAHTYISNDLLSHNIKVEG